MSSKNIKEQRKWTLFFDLDHKRQMTVAHCKMRRAFSPCRGAAHATQRAAPRVPSWRVMRRTHGMLLMTSCCLLPLTSAAQTANPDVRNAACSLPVAIYLSCFRDETQRPATSISHQVSFSSAIVGNSRDPGPEWKRPATGHQ